MPAPDSFHPGRNLRFWRLFSFTGESGRKLCEVDYISTPPSLQDSIYREYFVVTVGSATVKGGQGSRRYFVGVINDWYRVPDALTGMMGGGAKSHTRQKDSTAVEFAAVLMIIVFVTSYLLPKMFMERNFTNSVEEVWCCLV